MFHVFQNANLRRLTRDAAREEHRRKTQAIRGQSAAGIDGERGQPASKRSFKSLSRQYCTSQPNFVALLNSLMFFSRCGD